MKGFVMAYLKIFDINVPTEKTKTGQFDAREIMFNKEYGAYGEAIKKVSEKQYGELAFVFDTLINHLENWSGLDRWVNDKYINPSNRLFVNLFMGRYLNLNRAAMECDREAGKVKITLDYVPGNWEELRYKLCEITVLPAQSIKLCGAMFSAEKVRTVTDTQKEYKCISDTYTIDAGSFIK